jgi:N-acetylmuramoyl-L-alanine amidase
MEIKQKLIPATLTKTRPKIAMKPNWITIHETDNIKNGADAEAHARLQASGNVRTASWHFSVDQSEIWQSIPTNEVAWANGDGSKGEGNRESISIELCVNADGDFEKTKQNAVWLVQFLMKKYSIPISNVVQHNKWTGKNCPRNLRKSGWNEFINQIKAGGAIAVAASKTVANMYDLSYMKDYKLLGIRSSKHTDEICEKVADYMEANANCVLLIKRGFDLQLLQKTLNEMYPEDIE